MLKAPTPEVDTGEALPLLDVRDLTVEFQTRRGTVQAVKHVNISLAKGETLGIVGESGSGKSVTSYAVMRILDRAGRIADGSVRFSNLDLRQIDEGDDRDQTRRHEREQPPEPAPGERRRPRLGCLGCDRHRFTSGAYSAISLRSWPSSAKRTMTTPPGWAPTIVPTPN